MSFNKKTVNQLSDSQMADLKSEINAAAAANKAPAVDLSGVMSGIGSLQTGQGGINTNVAGVGESVTGGFADLNTYLAEQFGKAGNQRGDIVYELGKGLVELNNQNQGRADTLGGQITDVGGDVTQGFQDQTARFDTLDQSMGDVQTGVDTANTGIDNMTTEMGNRFDTTDKNFVEAGEALSKGFADTQGDIADAQVENLKGQGDILSDLQVATDDRNTYFDTLSGNQNTMLDNQEQYASTFDTYVDRYADDTTLQNETLGGIQSGLTNFAGDVNQGIANLGTAVNASAAANEKANNQTNANIKSIMEGGFSDVQGGFSDIASGQDQLGDALASGFAQNQNAFNQSQQALANFNNAMTNETAQANNQYDQITGQLRTLSQLSGLPDTLRQQFGQLSNSFDAQGNLIQNSIDEQGNTIVRAMDENGNMILRKFDASGSSMGQMVMNLNDTLAQMSALGRLPGANTGMGNLSAPLQFENTGSLGLMRNGYINPYGTTQ